MSRLIFWRLAQLPLLLLVIYTVTFLLAWAVPGNPLEEPEGRKPPKEVAEALKKRYNLDNPGVFYLEYLAGLARGDLGPSLRYTDQDVSDIIADSFPVSAQLGVGSIILALLIGVAAGVVGAVWRGSLLDAATLALVLIGISLPTFVTGSVLLMIFCLQLQWVPVGWGSPSQMFLPALALALPTAAYIARLTRLGMIDVMSSDVIRTARAQGLSERQVVLKPALKVAFLPVLSFLGPATAWALTGSFVIEKVFNIPGMGQHLVNAVQNKDLFLILGIVLVVSTLLILFNLLVDIAYSYVDPRIELD